MALIQYSSIVQNIVEFRLEDVPKLVQTLENLAQSLKQPSCVREFDMSEESRDAIIQLSVQAYCSVLSSAKLVRAFDKVLRCLPVSFWSSFLVQMQLVLERLLVSSRLADVKILSALLDQSLTRQLCLDNHFHACTKLLEDLLDVCSHVAPGASFVQAEEFQHYSVKLCIQVLQIFARDVKLAFSSACRDVDAVDVASARQRWNTIMATLVTLLLQSSTQDTVYLTGTALAMAITYAPHIDVTQTTCQGFLSVLSCEKTCMTFADMELNIQQFLSKTPSNVSVALAVIIKGMLVCCSKDILSQGKSPVLLQVLPYIVQLCHGPNKHHYQAFNLLALWCHKLGYSGLLYASSYASSLQVCLQKIITCSSESGASSVLISSLTVSNSGEPSDQISVGHLILTNTIACIWPHWDSPIDGVSELVEDIFHQILRMWQQSVQTGLFAGGDLHEQLMSSVLSLAWHSKARYRPLKVLLAYTDVLKVVDIHRQLSCDLLKCMKTNNLASVASDVYQACVQQIINHSTNLELQEGLQMWADVWMSTLLSGLTSADSVQTMKMCTYWLPTTLKLVTDSHRLLCESIEEQLRSSRGRSRQRWLFAWVSLAACARQQYHMASKNILTSRYLLESLLCVDDDVRIEALKLVCTSFKRGEPMSDVESCLLQEFITANLKTDSAAFRQHMTSALRKMFVRIRDSCLTAVRNSRTQEPFLASSLEFIEWLHQLLTDSLVPGGCYQRRQTSLALLRSLLETLVYQPDSTSRKGKAQESSDILLLYAREQDVWKFFTQRNFIVLVCCLEDGVVEIQTQSFDLLVKYHTWPQLTHMFSSDGHGDYSQTMMSPPTVPSGVSDRACADIFRRALQLMSSPRAYENHSAMLMISLLTNRCLMEHTWNSSSVSDELSQQYLLHCKHLVDPASLTDSDTCVPRKHVVSRVLVALVDMLIDRMKTSLDAVMDNLGTNYHTHSLHGVTQSLTRVLLDINDAIKKGLISLSAPDWKTRLEQTVSLNQKMVNFVLEVLAGRPNLESCPSFAEMGIALRSHISAGQELDDDVLHISPEFQLLLSWCWLNLKESCSCLGEVASLMVTPEGTCPQPVQLLSDIGQTFVKVLTTCRHRGAIEGSRQGLYFFCCCLMSSSVSDLAQMPHALLQQMLDSVSQNCLASSVTRRSAGLPIFIQTVLQAAHKNGHKSVLMHTVGHLYDIAAQELPVEHNQLQDLSQVHALHILKTVFSDASLAAQLLPQLSQMTILVLQGFDSPSWAIRNAATQLISTLVTRIFGQKAEGGGMSLEVFSTQFPLLLQFLCEQMKIYLSSKVTVKPSIYIVLTLLSELGMSPLGQHSACCRDFLRESVMCFMSSPVYSLRKLSAQAYVALSALDMADETLNSILQKIGDRNMKMNELHGWLLCAHCFMSSETISCDMSKSLLQFVVENSWVLVGLPNCLLPVSLVLQIIQMALARSQPDLPLFDRLWQLVHHCLDTLSTSKTPFQIDRDQCLQHCLHTLAALDRASVGLTDTFTQKLHQLLQDNLVSSQDHTRQAAMECLQANTVTTNAAIQRAVLVSMTKDTGVVRLVTCAHLILAWTLKDRLHLQASDFVAADLTSLWPQLQPVNFILHTICLGSGGVSWSDSSYHLLEAWSHQLLAYSQPTQNEDKRVLAASSLAIAGANMVQLAGACRHMPGLDVLLTSILRASLQLLEDTEVQVRQLVSRFLCQTHNLASLNFTWCYPALSQLLVSGSCWSCNSVGCLVEVLYTPGQLSTAVHAALSCRQQVLFEPETTSSMSESLVTQIWAYNTLQMKLAVSAGSQAWQTLQATVRCARDDLSSNMALLGDNLCQFPIFNISCHEQVVSSLLGVVLLMCLGVKVFIEDGQDKDSMCLQELVQSVLQMPFLHPFLGKSTLKDLTVAMSRFMPRQLPSLR